MKHLTTLLLYVLLIVLGVVVAMAGSGSDNPMLVALGGTCLVLAAIVVNRP